MISLASIEMTIFFEAVSRRLCVSVWICVHVLMHTAFSKNGPGYTISFTKVAEVTKPIDAIALTLECFTKKLNEFPQ